MPENEIKIFADQARLAQIIVNLIGNAIKYTPNGGQIAIAAFVERNNAVFQVCDDGIGIDFAQHENVFEIFSQVALSGPIKQDGLGIGLALIRHLAELHGGKIILVRSAPGEGSIFEVRLPYQ